VVSGVLKLIPWVDRHADEKFGDFDAYFEGMSAMMVSFGRDASACPNLRQTKWNQHPDIL